MVRAKLISLAHVTRYFLGWGEEALTLENRNSTLQVKCKTPRYGLLDIAQARPQGPGSNNTDGVVLDYGTTAGVSAPWV